MASSSAPSWKYDVFLSCSSQDAGNFSYLLHKDLNDRGILTIGDNQEVDEGAESTASLELGISQSRVAIVIFSPDYASSPRLLEQLVQIETNSDSGSLILPVFHFVSPSEVRKQSGDFGASFAKHKQEQDSEKVQRWRDALRSVAQRSGWNSDDHSGSQELINSIVETVRNYIPPEQQREKIIKQSVDKVSNHHSVEEKIIEQPAGDEVSRNTILKDQIINVSDNNELKEQNFTTDEKIIKQSVDKVSNHHSVEEKIIEQPAGDEVSRNTILKDQIISVSDNNELKEQNFTTDATSSAEWSFLLCTLILEVLSAGFDQASSPSKPHYALFAMLLAGAAVFTCIWELSQKKSIEMKSWGKLQCISISYPQLSDTFLESHLDTFGLVSSIYQCVFSAIQYGYFLHHASSPMSLCALPSLYLLCLAGTRIQKLYRKSKTLPL